MSDPAPPVVKVSTWTDPVFWVTTIGAIASGIAGTGVLENWTQTFTNDVKLWVTPASYILAFAFLVIEAVHAHLTSSQVLSLLEQWFASSNPTPVVTTGGVEVSSSVKKSPAITQFASNPYVQTWSEATNVQGNVTPKVTYTQFPKDDPEPPAAVPAV